MLVIFHITCSKVVENGISKKKFMRIGVGRNIIGKIDIL